MAKTSKLKSILPETSIFDYLSQEGENLSQVIDANYLFLKLRSRTNWDPEICHNFISFFFEEIKLNLLRKHEYFLQDLGSWEWSLCDGLYFKLISKIFNDLNDVK